MHYQKQLSNVTLEDLVNNARELINSGYYTDYLIEDTVRFDIPKLSDRIQNKFVVIGEIKPRSPSEGILYSVDDIDQKIISICPNVDAISILTEPNYFNGNKPALEKVLQYEKPILMKDIIISKEQIRFARNRASTILLIAKALSRSKLNELLEFAHEIDLEVIIEVDNEEHFQQYVDSNADVLAINNRNLSTFTVDKNRAKRIMHNFETDKPVLSFSGYDNMTDIFSAKTAGFSGVLIGTHLSKLKDPAIFLDLLQNSLAQLEVGR